MPKPGMKQTSMWLDEDDRAIITYIRERNGLRSDTAAMRVALRIAAQHFRTAEGRPRTAAGWPGPGVGEA
jgi:hypothetical protein